ncbi:FRG domain-containing protein [Moraxella bovis]|uniref:FRG domain-containing protein n=1 Tax=Moraxella bovis TaxID=476 RepID=A0AAX3EUU2_MORBO|nr:FRG domain-containing protein [Moraxella bovis]UYZ81028.1 FRG domain-containing protein [Moraxella bovis]UZA06401.1 FRG domain-containing protein [Moraxella bovis]UZA11371.1 FRG domain-containing protein [Moraxella bovis]UZA51824.1 FRG domain-containing protein [Moraxella bovis]
MSNEIRIKSVAEFVDRLSKLEKPKQGYTRFFRGHSNERFNLEPKVYRQDNWIENEHKIVKDVLTECAEYFSPHDTLFDKLVKMQHYGYPTRLLDITYNSLVALYFAVNENDTTTNKDGTNGEVIIFDIPNDEIKYHDSDTVAILSALSLRDESFDIEFYRKMAHKDFLTDTNLLLSQLRKNPLNLQDNLMNISKQIDDDILSYQDKKQRDALFEEINKKFNTYPEIIQLLNDIRKDKPYFLPNIDIRDIGRTLCVKPVLNNERIKKQQGAFLIFGIDENKLNPTEFRDIGENATYQHITIDKYAKSFIVNELKSFGISYQTLFPELENQAKYIINRYKDI